VVQSPLWPAAVALGEADQTLRLTWNDGHQSLYSWEFLRWHCPCAVCRGEGGLAGLLATLAELRPEQKQLVDLRPVGRYGVAPVWADGHSTGILRWRELRALCQCPACLAQSGTSDQQ